MWAWIDILIGGIVGGVTAGFCYYFTTGYKENRRFLICVLAGGTWRWTFPITIMFCVYRIAKYIKFDKI